jgi:hypothetical protein
MSKRRSQELLRARADENREALREAGMEFGQTNGYAEGDEMDSGVEGDDEREGELSRVGHRLRRRSEG